MWEIIRDGGDDYYRHATYPQWEIHHGTQGSRFELRNTKNGTRAPLFKDNPNANIHTVMDVADDAIRTNEFTKKIKDTL
jgi:hypothetical protein